MASPDGTSCCHFLLQIYGCRTSANDSRTHVTRELQSRTTKDAQGDLLPLCLAWTLFSRHERRPVRALAAYRVSSRVQACSRPTEGDTRPTGWRTLASRCLLAGRGLGHQRGSPSERVRGQQRVRRLPECERGEVLIAIRRKGGGVRKRGKRDAPPDPRTTMRWSTVMSVATMAR